VCGQDAFCCEVAWDSICVSEALDCACGGDGAGSCFEIHGSTGCSIESCCQTVCVEDTFCCEVTWDHICVNEALAMCACGVPQGGDCFEAHDAPGCNDADCCEAVCEIDPFCCDIQWDSICANEAGSLCPQDDTGDINGDGSVNVNDLVLVVLDWGCQGDGCKGDADGNGVTNVNDLVLVILNWTP
jgi:hypothetical protein